MHATQNDEEKFISSGLQ